MSTHAQRSSALASKIVDFAENALSGLEREMVKWPADFSAIMWEAVADIASRRAEACRQRDTKK